MSVLGVLCPAPACARLVVVKLDELMYSHFRFVHAGAAACLTLQCVVFPPLTARTYPVTHTWPPTASTQGMPSPTSLPPTWPVRHILTSLTPHTSPPHACVLLPFRLRLSCSCVPRCVTQQTGSPQNPVQQCSWAGTLPHHASRGRTWTHPSAHVCRWVATADGTCLARLKLAVWPRVFFLWSGSATNLWGPW